eukprot:342567-Prorocentrum_minimum.AAC.1
MPSYCTPPRLGHPSALRQARGGAINKSAPPESRVTIEESVPLSVPWGDLHPPLQQRQPYALPYHRGPLRAHPGERGLSGVCAAGRDTALTRRSQLHKTRRLRIQENEGGLTA